MKAAGNSEQFIVAGATHPNFSDAGLTWSLANGIALGSIDPNRMVLIMRDVVRSFVDAQVRGAQSGDFAATVARFPELSPSQ